MHSLARLHQEALAKFNSARAKISRHEGMVTRIAEETFRTGANLGGAAAAAVVDHYMGPKGVDLPEAMVGPVPVVLTGALVMKGVAFALSKHDVSKYVHEVGSGLGAAGTYATLLRTLKASSSPAAAAAAAAAK